MESLREKINLVRTSESNLRKEVKENLIEPLNSVLYALNYKTAVAISECLEDKKLDYQQAMECKKNIEEIYRKKEDAVVFYAQTFNDELLKCLQACKSNISLKKHQCYCGCLDLFGDIAAKID